MAENCLCQSEESKTSDQSVSQCQRKCSKDLISRKLERLFLFWKSNVKERAPAPPGQLIPVLVINNEAHMTVEARNDQALFNVTLFRSDASMFDHRQSGREMGPYCKTMRSSPAFRLFPVRIRWVKLKF